MRYTGPLQSFIAKDMVRQKWIADCGDPFMLNATENYTPPFYFKQLEKSWCNRCDFITVPTETSHEGYYPEFKSKIRVIPQAFNFDEVELGRYLEHNVPTFAFSGRLYSTVEIHVHFWTI